ncbi:hypothetical protein HY501_00835 [Candidatus Woesearchaeota archaeon]|nr:hypothetical protein [Candidatus Woesearchaeota archaeon]
MKKGQASLFVIIGITIFLVLIAAFYFTSQRARTEEEAGIARVLSKATVKEIAEEKVGACFDFLMKEGLLISGLQGGYLDRPENVRDHESGYFLALYGDKGEASIISLTDFESSLEKHVENNMEDCIDKTGFAPFVLESSEPQATVTLGETVEAELNYRVAIIAEEERIGTQNRYDFSHALNIPAYLELSQEIIKDAQENPADFDFNLILDRNFNGALYPVEEGLNIYMLADDTLIEEVRFTLRFGYAY